MRARFLVVGRRGAICTDPGFPAPPEASITFRSRTPRRFRLLLERITGADIRTRLVKSPREWGRRVPSNPTDYLANERTFLAWVRTAVTIMAFGFVVARFGLLLRELSGSSTGSAPTAPISEATGVLLVLAGSVVLALAFARFLRSRDDLQSNRFESRVGLEWALTSLLVAVGAGVALYLLFTG